MNSRQRPSRWSILHLLIMRMSLDTIILVFDLLWISHTSLIPLRSQADQNSVCLATFELFITFLIIGMTIGSGWKRIMANCNLLFGSMLVLRVWWWLRIVCWCARSLDIKFYKLIVGYVIIWIIMAEQVLMNELKHNICLLNL